MRRHAEGAYRRWRPNSTIRIGAIDEEHHGYLFQALEVQTAIAGSLYGLNAFDQPGVERTSKLPTPAMRRPDTEKPLRSCSPPDVALVVFSRLTPRPPVWMRIRV